jgi:hypothetical protein
MSGAESARLAGRLSIAYMMAITAEVLRVTSLDFLDVLLVTAIANVNASPPPPDARRARGYSPSAGATGISRNAVSRLLNIPLETVRRRVGSLLQKGVLIEQPDGLVFTPNNAVGLGDNAALNAFNLERLRDLFRGLKAAGIVLD